ncbi:uncharacterized protein LOC105194205 [Solenopsis invicta]|uniref:uncharacterized protein LOC105194205 n=1 Tax=Solenopsis invicta TaxID=13686 RepID=UPI00193CE349|nr:uncharacterized protein LOC105194205 [Solenopsis invicta]
MGNANSAQPPKSQKDRKEDHCNMTRANVGIETYRRNQWGTQKRTLQFRLLRSADTGKGRQPASGSGKAASQSLQAQRDGHNVRPRATNPFIIFFLRLRSKKPNEHVTVIARAAGKLWSQMTPEQRKKYVDLANEEKKRRQERKRKRKRSTYSR